MKTPYLARGLDYQGRHPEALDAHMEWLQAFTWIQLDGSIDFTRPRQRPMGLPIAPAEIDRMALCTAEAPEAAHAACEEGMDSPAVRRRRELSPGAAVFLWPGLVLLVLLVIYAAGRVA
jgi:hypothetical protein